MLCCCVMRREIIFLASKAGFFAALASILGKLAFDALGFVFNKKNFLFSLPNTERFFFFSHRVFSLATFW